jgi:uncharacterized damage-inducible protein DinB
MKPIHLRILTISILILTAAITMAQEKAPAPAARPSDALTSHSRFVYQVIAKMVLRSAELMPEENYSFKPTEVVRSFGQIVGHIADAQYTFCSVARGEKNPLPKVEKTKTSKADLTASLTEAFAYCDKAYDGMSDASGAEVVKMMGRDMPRLGVLSVSQNHTMEHYGNIVTYLRMKNVVPPTSDPEFMKQASQPK